MEENKMKENKKVSLVTYILSLIIMGLAVALCMFLILNKDNNDNNEEQTYIETNEILSKVNETQNEVVNKTEQTNTNAGEINELADFKNDEKLKDFLGYMGELNSLADENFAKLIKDKNDYFLQLKIMIAAMNTKLGVKKEYITYNITQIEEAIKEIFNENIDVQQCIKDKKCPIFYSNDVGAYIDGGGDAVYSSYIVDIESCEKLNDIYEITFLHAFPSEGDFADGTEGECDCFRTKVKIRINKNYKYSKFQIVDTNLSGEKVGKVKDFEKKDKTTNKVENKTEEANLLQFDTKFYDLKSAALEYRNLYKIKNYKDFEYDLDGDGKKDKVTIKNIGKNQKEDDYDVYKIYLNDTEFYKTEAYDGYELYIVDLNENDNKINVIINILGPNDVTNYLIYSKQNNKMNKIKEINSGWELSVDKKGKLVLDNALTSSISPRIYEEYYQLENDSIKTYKANMEKVKNTTFDSDIGVCFTQDKNSLKKYYDANITEEKWEDGLKKHGMYVNQKFKFNVINFEESNFAYGCLHVKLNDGREGYLFSVAYNLAG